MEKFYKFIKHETFVSYSQSKFINRFIGYKKKGKDEYDGVILYYVTLTGNKRHRYISYYFCRTYTRACV